MIIRLGQPVLSIQPFTLSQAFSVGAPFLAGPMRASFSPPTGSGSSLIVKCLNLVMQYSSQHPISLSTTSLKLYTQICSNFVLRCLILIRHFQQIDT